MGKGINAKPSGVHIAFSGGTGVLCYLDLVAYLIRENLGQNSAAKGVKIDKDFKFILYVSYASLKDSIAREMCLGLQTICSKLNISNFEYHERISNSGANTNQSLSTTAQPLQEKVK